MNDKEGQYRSEQGGIPECDDVDLTSMKKRERMKERKKRKNIKLK